MENTDYYNSLGSYFEDEDFVKKEINTKLYNEIKIKVIIIAVNGPIAEIKPIYKVLKLEYEGDTERNKDCIEVIKEVNSYLRDNGKEKGYKADSNYWSVFYLLKELITAFKLQDFNYFRGQRCSWETIPSIFRSIKNSEGDFFYSQFENLYKKISMEFPDEIQYCGQEGNQEERTDQLATLQHYGFPTSLLDITENPYIAMLFMFAFGEIEVPQLEMYKIDQQEHVDNGLVSFIHKGRNNKRVKAQKGAFINYDKLDEYVKTGKNTFNTNKNYSPIDRIVVSLEISIDETQKYLDEQKKTYEVNTEHNLSEDSQSLSLKNLEYISSSLCSDTGLKSYYKRLQNDVIMKLKEFNYFSSELYPDFRDYIGFRAKEFTLTTQDKKNTYVDLTKLDSE